MAPFFEPCETCEGRGYVWEDPAHPEDQPRKVECETCEGTGKTAANSNSKGDSSDGN